MWISWTNKFMKMPSLMLLQPLPRESTGTLWGLVVLYSGYNTSVVFIRVYVLSPVLRDHGWGFLELFFTPLGEKVGDNTIINWTITVCYHICSSLSLTLILLCSAICVCKMWHCYGSRAVHLVAKNMTSPKNLTLAVWSNASNLMKWATVDYQ